MQYWDLSEAIYGLKCMGWEGHLKVLSLTIGRRLAAGFGSIIAVTMAVTAIGVFYLYLTAGSIEMLVSHRFPQLLLANTIRMDFNELMTSTRKIPSMSVAGDVEGIQTERSLIEQSSHFVEENTAKLESADFLTEDERKNIQDLKAAYSNFAQALSQFLAVSAGDAAYKEPNLPGELQVASVAYTQILDTIVRQTEEHSLSEGRRSTEAIQRALILMLFIAAAGLIGGIVISTITTRKITRPLKEAVSVAKQIAAGDLTTNIVASSQDETGMLMQSLRDMNDSLKRIVEQVRQDTANIQLASSEIADGTLNLSVRTEQQASSLAKTAESISQLNFAVKHTTDNATLANEQAKTATENAIRGGSVVSQVVETMELIKKSSRRIAEIIGVVDGIAFQTNILALNAAVEAARAGNQGRGFAVVAAEVRSLAQRSAEASKEITALIGESVQSVDMGSTLVATAGQTMDEIVISVKRVAHLMSEITEASRDQSDDFDALSTALRKMDEMTQQNAAMVDEATAASAELKARAEELVEAVSLFKINSDVANMMCPQ
ncbi:MAG TPA: methyl-accepting chemotaxis protein [Noviherbaspirillum sp.]|uniref:methyl-accepting chemotaxis protein n=1 Tax=Noviherbaspirillum sp. TaxID=1926288 RepID=UPI002D75CE6D|nr:methyl-accepting chemotaxis protein [Noviherbaspirillum sp.]HYD95381.1 methyl-accepting chemotaxis protein [Noviherbaspirillum sp.]